MSATSVKQALRDGEIAVGLMVMEFATTGISRVAAEAGADFVVFDMEHTGWTATTMREMMAASMPSQVCSLVRLPSPDYPFLGSILDVGAHGLMIPNIETAEQAREVVARAKYPPLGHRGFGLIHADPRFTDLRARLDALNHDLILIVQIETSRGLRNIESIASVEGIDVIFVGPYDLTISLGIAGSFDHPKYSRAIEQILDVCHRTGKAPGTMAPSANAGSTLIQQGFRCLTYMNDMSLLREALQRGIHEIRESAPVSTNNLNGER